MQVEFFFIYLEKLIGETEMLGRTHLLLCCLTITRCRCNCMRDNKSLSEFVIICDR